MEKPKWLGHNQKFLERFQSRNFLMRWKKKGERVILARSGARYDSVDKKRVTCVRGSHKRQSRVRVQKDIYIYVYTHERR